MIIPHFLEQQIHGGNVVLFLGSGASIGALHKTENKPPIGNELANLIATKFLGSEYLDRPLSYVADLAISESNLVTVQEYIASIFTDFHPSDFHKLIANFVWRAIATTNYDLIIERAYSSNTAALQTPIPFKRNGERIEEKLKAVDSLCYYKLHGCITVTNDPSLPLILTPDQYITHRKNRSRLFERLHDLAYENPIVFIGNSLSDIDIRAILNELDQLGDAKPRSYIVAPDMPPAEKRFWEGRRYTCLEGKCEDFFNTLESSIPKATRRLATLFPIEQHPITKKFTSGTKPSSSLETLLNRDLEYIYEGYKTTAVDPKAFYKGYLVDWSPVIFGFDVKRDISDKILEEIFLSNEAEKADSQELVVIKGHAGSGKTVTLRRVAWDAATLFDKVCFSVKASSHPEYEPLYELYSHIKQRIYLFIDPASDYSDIIRLFMDRARKDKMLLSIITCERSNEWNTYCTELHPYQSTEYELKYLSLKEIGILLDLLEKNNSLGYMEGMLPEQQKELLTQKAGRQLLVALHEATSGKPFEDIIYDEYKSISNPQAQSLYLTVAIMHRLGVQTRAGLISRVHGIPFSEFKDKLFKPLEYVVFAREDSIIKDHVYLTRHQNIAEIIFERALVGMQSRYDEYIRILNHLDIDYNADRAGFKGLVSARMLLSIFPNQEMIRNIFAISGKRCPDDPMLLQQQAIFEMHADGGNLEKAKELLDKSYKLASTAQKKPISHSIAMLLIKQAEHASNPAERIKLREKAKILSSELASSDPHSSHPFHTLIKLGIDEIKDAIEVGDDVYFERKVKEVEEYIFKALQSHPSDSYILDAESQFCHLIKADPKALDSLKKAFSSNKKSPYIASRLAKVYKEMGRDDEAMRVLKECLDINPSSKDIHFTLAKYLIDIKPDSPDIIHHLRRSFTKGDVNYNAQFWYARSLYLSGQISEALDVFKSLGDSNASLILKKDPQAIVIENNMPKLYIGKIRNVEYAHAFIIKDGTGDKIFAYRFNGNDNIWDQLKAEKRVVFEIAFNYKGPVAINIQSE